ncbi:MAG: metallophosphoesterase [Bacteroidales bacterium]|nr:metallophosphoesterase [Bacteroidales bacterium]
MVTRHEVSVTRVEIESSRIPHNFDGYTIAQFSDAHVGTWGKDTVFISTLVDSINALHADLIVFTGDIVNRSTPELEPFLRVLSRLHAPDGVVSILGNHDYGDYMDWSFPSEKAANLELLAAWQRQMGWRLLRNEHIFLSRGTDSIPLIGVENWGEPPFKQYGKLEKAYPAAADSPFNLNDGRFKILLSHNPEHWRQEVREVSDIDLTLAGHTHAMQFMIEIGSFKWSPAEYKYEQWAGLYEYIKSSGFNSRIYVNVGSGEVGMPFRIGATPEITLFTLRNTN